MALTNGPAYGHTSNRRVKLLWPMAVAALTLIVAGCGGSSLTDKAASLTKRAMQSERANYDHVDCIDNGNGSITCNIVDHGSTTGACVFHYDNQKHLADFAPSRDCGEH